MTLGFRFSGKKSEPFDINSFDGKVVPSKIFKRIFIERLKERVFNADAMHSIGADVAADFIAWQNSEIQTKCTFLIDDYDVSIDMPVVNWDCLVSQSIMFDTDIFINDLNTMYTRYGWFVVGFSHSPRIIRIAFRQFSGDPIKYLPRFLYYLTAVWNRDEALSQGLLPTFRHDSTSDVCYYEYDVFLKSADLPFIKSASKSLLAFAQYNGELVDFDGDALPIIVFEIDTRLFLGGTLPYCEDDGGALRFFTFVPPSAISKIIYEDKTAPIINNTPAQRNKTSSKSLIHDAIELARSLLK